MLHAYTQQITNHTASLSVSLSDWSRGSDSAGGSCLTICLTGQGVLGVQESAVANLKSLDVLVGWVARSQGGRTVVGQAIDAAREAFITVLLPDRKLKWLSQQPLAALEQSKLGEKRLLLWTLEDALKQRSDTLSDALSDTSLAPSLTSCLTPCMKSCLTLCLEPCLTGFPQPV
jgi:hypothetical protein